MTWTEKRDKVLKLTWKIEHLLAIGDTDIAYAIDGDIDGAFSTIRSYASKRENWPKDKKHK